MDSRVNILNLTRPELGDKLKDLLGLEPFRARQIFPWLYKQRLSTFEPMTNITKSVRAQLSEHFRIYRPELRQLSISQDGSRKYLFGLDDGQAIESVLIRQPSRYTLCLSSQVGCAIKCSFCKTGTMGLVRNLKTYEIVSQVLAVRDDIYQSFQEKIGQQDFPDFVNIVFMGMGEPLNNLVNVIPAIKILNDELGLNLSGRKITVSTSGIVPGIKALGESEARANLALSLNATTDKVRESIMPINKSYPLAELLQALRQFPLRGRQRITIEYVLIKGLNDTTQDLKRLPKLLNGIPVKVNLIPYNPITGLGYQSPSRETITTWQDSLLSAGINATIRWSKADDISGACGQLATCYQ